MLAGTHKIALRTALHSAAFALALGTACSGQVMVTAAKPAKTPAKPVAAQPTSTQPAVGRSAAALLPEDFAGWVRSGAAQTLAQAPAADPANAAALTEYGFHDGAAATYVRGSEKLTLHALRFADATGAYGAYTFYRHSGWPKLEIGAGAASDNDRILFWQGNTFVDATVSHVSAMTASDLRELAADLRRSSSVESLAPTVVADLPNVPGDGPLQGQTTHYALGPVGYTGSGGVLPPALVGFDRSAEVVTANYALRSGPATLTLINYPTPQIAQSAEQALSAYVKAGSAAQPTDAPASTRSASTRSASTRPASTGLAWTAALANSTPGSVLVKRSGPLVAVVSGDAVPDDAQRLIGLVHYDADVSRLPGGGPTEVQKTAQLLLGILLLVGVLFLAALSVALFLGGGRALIRLAQGKPASTIFDEEFTRLDLH